MWIRPELVAHVELTEFTNEGYVRQSSFIDLVVTSPVIVSRRAMPHEALDAGADDRRWTRRSAGAMATAS